MSWDNESVIKLIDAYKRKELLWDPKQKNYFNKLLKKDAWDELEVELQRPLEQIKKKMDYLLAALRREKQKITKTKTTGQGSDEVYRSSWFAYPHMLFLLDRNKPRDRINTEDLIEDNEKVLDDGSEVSAEEGIGNQAHVNEVPETPESQLDESQVTMTQESRNPASAATKFKHPVPIKKAKKSVLQNDPILSEALQLMRSSAQAATATLASTASSAAVAPDQYQIYANYLASKFRTYTATTYMAVEHQINNILFSADRGEFDWERGYLTDSNSSQASTPASTPNQNVANSEKSQHSDDFSDLVRFNNL
ncbi:uncharacterized protein LOC125062119 [Pieris napi]|uniref:uncharacterized protein LOC125062119 n=1 Tax=Pieris napi TaxID=78633 RepID=UPI001FBB11B1|nr:uncharacterized protein LOC125062119 [Pieris napi]